MLCFATTSPAQLLTRNNRADKKGCLNDDLNRVVEALQGPIASRWKEEGSPCWYQEISHSKRKTGAEDKAIAPSVLHLAQDGQSCDRDLREEERCNSS